MALIDDLERCIAIVRRGTPTILNFIQKHGRRYNEEDVSGYDKSMEIYSSGLGPTLVVKGDKKDLKIWIDDDDILCWVIK